VTRPACARPIRLRRAPEASEIARAILVHGKLRRAVGHARRGARRVRLVKAPARNKRPARPAHATNFDCDDGIARCCTGLLSRRRSPTGIHCPSSSGGCLRGCSSACPDAFSLGNADRASRCDAQQYIAVKSHWNGSSDALLRLRGSASGGAIKRWQN